MADLKCSDSYLSEPAARCGRRTRTFVVMANVGFRTGLQNWNPGM